jgi:hypothetical protein
MTTNFGIVFLDEVDKIVARKLDARSDISKEGVQRDLLPLLHYKFYHLQFLANGKSGGAFDAYYSVTQGNLRRMLNDRELHQRQAMMSPFTYEWLGYEFIPLPSVMTLRLSFGKKGNVSQAIADHIQRRAAINVAPSSVLSWCSMNGLRGPNINSAVDWVRTNTPFKNLIQLDEYSAELSI